MHTRHHEFDLASRAIAADGWCVLPSLMTARQTDDLAGECRTLYDGHRLTPARIGRDLERSTLRGDSTRWFEPSALSAPQGVFAGRIEQLRIALNHALMLGLVDSESHYAMYPPGAGYARHLDRPRHNDARVLSAVFYLNDAWQESDGGALRLHLANGSYRDIYPHAGTLLLFLSAQFEHEVLPASRPRMSIACWMRQQELT